MKIIHIINPNGAIVLFLLFLFLSTRSQAQNSSYSTNTNGIAGFYNSSFGIQSQSLNNTFAFYNTSVGYQSLYSNTSGSYNEAYGYKSLFSNTTGTLNIGIGHSALYANTTGFGNTALGSSALYNNTNGNTNSAFGASSLYSNTSGYGNLAFGESSLFNNTSGYWNTAIGSSALINNVSGYRNVAIGIAALASNTLGFNNTALGDYANVGANNLSNATAIGSGAIVNNSNSIQLGNTDVTTIYAGTGTNATLITGGLQVTGGSTGVGKVLTSDAAGVATWQTPGGGGGGDWSLTGNAGTVDGTNFIGTTDNKPFNIRVNNEKAGKVDQTSSSTFFGFRAGNNNTIGAANTGIGYRAFQLNTTGFLNTAIGTDAMYNNANGEANTGFGVAALYRNTSGSFNTGAGNLTLYNNFTGEANTALGYAADVSTDGLFNSTAIGALAIVNTSNKIRFGDPTVTAVEGPVAYTISDGRFKENLIETDVKGLEFIKLLRPVVYNFNSLRFQEFLTQNMPDSIRNKYFEGRNFEPSTSIRQSGLIAQEVEIAAQQSGYNFNGLHKPESKDDYYSLSYAQFVIPLIKSVQELSGQNQAMKQTINEQQEINASLKRDIDELRIMIKNGGTENKTGSIEINASSDDARLFQNAPNPFNKSTIIKYSIPSSAKKAILTISSIEGAKLKEFDLQSKGGQNIEISGGQLSAGTYIYSLIIDGLLIDSKKMILTR